MAQQLDERLLDSHVIADEDGGLAPRPGGVLPGLGERPVAADVPEPRGEDARTLWADFDDQGERWKDWRRAVQESWVEVFPDSPIEGPAS